MFEIAHRQEAQKQNVKAKAKGFLLALTIVAATASLANACTCGEISACEAFANASAVFVGVVTKAGIRSVQTQFPATAMSATRTNGGPAAHFKIEEAFGGIATDEIDISGGGTTCDYYFKEGERYLVYAYRNEDGTSFTTNICSRTSPLSQATDDLNYLRGAVKGSPGGTVFGDIFREPRNVTDEEAASEPIPRAEIIFENGTQSFQAISDEKGKFEINGLAKGRYKVHTNPATNYSGADVMAESPRNTWALDVPDRGCTQMWFVARPAGEISGTVTEASGVVGQDLWAGLIPVDGPVDNSKSRSAKLVDSLFRFSFLAPGRYYLGFNLSSGPSLEEPYPEFYYPGVEDRARATIITISEGQRISGIKLPRPLRLAERMIEGFAEWPDGRPYVENCGIKLTNPRSGYREGNCVSTDDHGHFVVKAIEGQTYELSGTVTDGKSPALLNSKPVVIKVGKENPPVKIVVQQP